MLLPSADIPRERQIILIFFFSSSAPSALETIPPASLFYYKGTVSLTYGCHFHSTGKQLQTVSVAGEVLREGGVPYWEHNGRVLGNRTQLTN